MWTGFVNHAGYGYMSVGGSGKTFRVHRVAWELAHGAVATGLVVRHKVCDNPPCCEVSHLEVGTQLDNAVDKRANGRQQRGADMPAAKLTEAVVLACRRRARDGVPCTALAKEFGVAHQVMWQALRGTTWAYLDPTTRFFANGNTNPKGSAKLVLTDKIVVECRARAAAGEKILPMARALGIAYPTLRQAIVGRTWKHVPMP